ncbi:MAG: tmoT [Candidatus Aminicenantes bacterium]|nr:tmoT [Candidatus Aminicenantes bacterium]
MTITGRPSLRFWIVDDDLAFGMSLKRLLNARGFPAEYFGSAQSFLDSVPPGQTGCAIVDIHMPVDDGFALLKKMRAGHYEIPVIIITGQADVKAQDRAIQAGAAGFLQKPFSEELLMELIGNIIENSRRRPGCPPAG